MGGGNRGDSYRARIGNSCERSISRAPLGLAAGLPLDSQVHFGEDASHSSYRPFVDVRIRQVVQARGNRSEGENDLHQ